MPKPRIGKTGRTAASASSPNSQPSSFVDLAYTRVREGILRGEYPFGTPLPARGLAGELGMSFLPVVKALERLQREGLVENLPRVSTRVVVPTPDRLAALYDVREACEVQAARLAAERATAAERRALLQLATRVDAAYERLEDRSTRQTLVITNQLHTSLHQRIAEVARSPQLLQAAERSQALIFRLLLELHRPTAPADDERHVPLVEAIASGDPSAAEAAMRHHIRASATHVSTFAGRLLDGAGGERRSAHEPRSKVRRRR